MTSGGSVTGRGRRVNFFRDELQGEAYTPGHGEPIGGGFGVGVGAGRGWGRGRCAGGGVVEDGNVVGPGRGRGVGVGIAIGGGGGGMWNAAGGGKSQANEVGAVGVGAMEI